MPGLLDGVLPFIYSQSNRAKNKLSGLLSDPVGTVTQAIGDANDRAGGLLSLTRAATEEGIQQVRQGIRGPRPATNQLMQVLADAYNPIGMHVYHGSPYKFAKFDSSKIGTGEGMQAYGHGLYVAESPGVAKSYADNLSQFHIATKNGIKPGGEFVDDLIANAGSYHPSLASAIESQANKITLDLMRGKSSEQVIASMRNGPYARMYAGLTDAVEKLSPSKASGSLYKVDLPDDAIAKMLDWDKPLSQQPGAVRAAASRRLDELRALGGRPPANPDGEWLHRAFQPQASEQGFGQALAADRLREAGIPGVRYLDGGSRGVGKGTSNFVVFPGEESLLTILERNGVPVR